MNRISVIIPAYNEEISIGSMVLQVKKYADQVVVVDDGSMDRTSEVAEMAGAEVIRHSINKGKGAALKSGFKAIKNADIIVTMDADGQHDPDDIPKLVAPIIADEADIVNGSRYLAEYEHETPGYRRVGQKVLDKFTNISSGLNITDSQSGFRAFKASTIPVFRFTQKGFGVESEMLVDAANSGFRIKEVEIEVRYDVGVSTKNPVSHGVGVLWRVLQEMQLNRPLYYFTIPGLVIAIIGAILGLIFFRDYVTGHSTILTPTILAILMTLVGIFMMFTGIILDSISKLFVRSLKRP